VNPANSISIEERREWHGSGILQSRSSAFCEKGRSVSHDSGRHHGIEFLSLGRVYCGLTLKPNPSDLECENDRPEKAVSALTLDKLILKADVWGIMLSPSRRRVCVAHVRSRLAPCSPEQISEAVATKRAPVLSRQLLGHCQSGISRKITLYVKTVYRPRLEGVDVIPDDVAFYSI
jgi:hypothetical protein